MERDYTKKRDQKKNFGRDKDSYRNDNKNAAGRYDWQPKLSDAKVDPNQEPIKKDFYIVSEITNFSEIFYRSKIVLKIGPRRKMRNIWLRIK